jgi:5-hydroxyisourate hydrolase
MGISTHVLDLAAGAPAREVEVRLERAGGEAGDAGAAAWRELGSGRTDGDGRVRSLLPEGVAPEAGTYRIVFATGAWAAARGLATFYPEVAITFEVVDPEQHHHVPLLLGPYGYTTYRGS